MEPTEAASQLANVLGIANIVSNILVVVIGTYFARWVYRLQKGRLNLKDQEMKLVEREIKIVERERDEARNTSSERLDLATRLRNEAERQLKQVLDEKGLAEGIQTAGVAELEPEAKNLLRALLDRLQGLEQLAPTSESTESHLLKGNAHHGAGEFDLAIAEYTQAIKLNPDYVKAYNNRGLAFNGKEEYGQAIEDYDKAIRLIPDYAPYYTNRGVAYDRKDEYDRAIEDFDQAIRLNPDAAIAYSNRSASLIHKRQYDLAIDDCNEAIRLDPDYAHAYVNRGFAYTFLDRGSEAQQDFERAVELGYGRARIDKELEELRREHESSDE